MADDSTSQALSPGTIPDNEPLYRSIKPNSECYSFQGGALKISSTAFNDRGEKVSVDRASLLATPEDARLGPLDGVLMLHAGDVRSETFLCGEDGKKPSTF